MVILVHIMGDNGEALRIYAGRNARK
ncbi:uncharacterized protein METZ01_LOCUS331286 [marine metagenome]|uniref:Uncharacterized protein n=1 Tax=marine metagenome TaxID=408172 RepID=A0A382Q203_9ZZZZ